MCSSWGAEGACVVGVKGIVCEALAGLILALASLEKYHCCEDHG
jgi:hypothetical protein